MSKCLLFTFVIAAIGSDAGSPASAEDLSLLLSVHGAAEPYQVEGRTQAGYLVFDDQPFVVQVTLHNETNEIIRVQGDQKWTDLLTLRLESLNGRLSAQLRFDVTQLVHRPSGLQTNPSVLAPGDAQEALLQIRSESTPSPGVYRVRAAVNRGSLSGIKSEMTVRLFATDTIEVRHAESINETLNLLYTRATRARLNGRNQEARDFLAQLLALHQASVIAWYEMGVVWADERNCREAATSFAHANALIDAQADPEEVTARRNLRGDLRRGMQRLLQSCRQAP